MWFAVPMILGNLLQQFYNIADTLIVGQFLGANALAAVGSAYSLMIFLTSVLLGLCMGSGAIFSLQYGAGDREALKRSIFVSLVLIGLVTLVLNVAVFVWIDPILRLLQVPEAVYPLMRDYLWVIFWGIGFTFIYNYYASLLRAIHTTYFSSEQAGTNYLHPRKNYVNANLFAEETQDYRFQSCWRTASNENEGGYDFIKYEEIAKPTQAGESEYFYAVFMSLIRLSEVYYIAAECEPVLADKYEWLNKMRERRGLSALTVVSDEDFMKRLRTEYLREFMGEGQIFFMYKRLYAHLFSDENGNDANAYEAREERYVLPLPSGEIANR